MAVNLSPIWGAGAQLFDNSGNVLTGGKIYTYAAGTTTPAATYTSSSGVTANSNPIILNSAGRVPEEIWLTDGVSYKFVLKDSNDVLIATYDNLSGINSNFIAYTAQQEIQTATAGQTVFNLTTMQYQPNTNNLAVYVDGVNQYGPGAQYAFVETDTDTVTFVSGLHVGASVKFTTASPVASAVTDAELVNYLPPFTGAVGTNVELKLAQTVSVKDFGAVGDGVADDTAAIQSAADYAGTLDNGCGIQCDGTFLTTDTINVTGKGTYFFATSQGSGVFKRATDFGPTFSFGGSSTVLEYTGLKNILFTNTGTMTATSGAFVVFDNCYSPIVNTCVFRNGWAGIDVLGCDNGFIENTIISATSGSTTNRFGIRFGYSSTGSRIGGDFFVNNTNLWCGTKDATVNIVPYMDYGIKVEGIDGLWLSDVHVIATKVANYSIGTTNGYSIGNIYATQAMSDICEGNGLELVGTSGVNYMTWSGRISGLGQTDASKNGLVITSPCAELRFDISVDEFDGDGVYINNASAYNIDFVAPNIYANDYDESTAGSGFNIVQGNGITITGGHIRGASKQQWGILLGANASEITVNGVRIEDNVAGGIKLTAGCAYIDLLNSDVRNNTNFGGKAIDNPGTITGLLIDNCSGYTPLTNSKSWTPGSIVNLAQTYTSVTVFGAELGDYATVSSSIDTSGVNLNAYVSGTNTVIVNAINTSGGTVTLGALTLYVKVDKRS